MKLKKIKEFIYNNVGGFTLLPFTLGVNIINKCNRECSFCLYRSPKLERTEFIEWLYGQKEQMSVVDFERFISRLGIFRFMIDNIGLTGKGEPFLHPDVMKFCDILEKYKIKFSLTTNGDLIEKHLIKLATYKYLRHLRISIYSTNRYHDLKWIKDTSINVHFYNMTGEPIDGVETGVKLWASGLDGENTIPKDFNKIDTCTKPFSYISLNPDGTIVFCNSYYEIGDWNDNIFKILNSKRSREFRKSALRMDVPKADCLNCFFNGVV